jgi:hypothetical protein
MLPDFSTASRIWRSRRAADYVDRTSCRVTIRDRPCSQGRGPTAKVPWPILREYRNEGCELQFELAPLAEGASVSVPPARSSVGAFRGAAQCSRGYCASRGPPGPREGTCDLSRRRQGVPWQKPDASFDGGIRARGGRRKPMPGVYRIDSRRTLESWARSWLNNPHGRRRPDRPSRLCTTPRTRIRNVESRLRVRTVHTPVVVARNARAPTPAKHG